MAALDDEIAQYCIQAIATAAEELGTDPLRLAKRLHGAQIARLTILLNAALPHVAHAGLRHRIEDLLSEVTGGRMPMSGRPESELDWALQSLRRRRLDQEHRATSDVEEAPDA